ncbi:MAG: YbaN family protein [Myxococcota bacterium]
MVGHNIRGKCAENPNMQGHLTVDKAHVNPTGAPSLSAPPNRTTEEPEGSSKPQLQSGDRAAWTRTERPGAVPTRLSVAPPTPPEDAPKPEGKAASKPVGGWKGLAYKTAGTALVGLATAGVFVPGLPTTVFLLGAAGCFAKSSPKLHSWLQNHSRFGPMIRDWEENRSMPKKAKVVAFSGMGVGAAVTLALGMPLVAKIAALAFIAAGAATVYRVPTTESLKRPS